MEGRCDLCSQVWKSCGTALAVPRRAARRALQNFGQFGGEGTARRVLAISTTALAALGARLEVASGIGSGDCLVLGLRRSRRIFAFGRLSRVSPQKPVFKRCAIEAANDRLHLVGGRCFYKCEALGFLRFVVADHLYGVGHQAFGGEPLFDVIGGDPSWEVAKKYGETHSVDYLLRRLDFAALQGEDSLPSK